MSIVLGACGTSTDDGGVGGAIEEVGGAAASVDAGDAEPRPTPQPVPPPAPVPAPAPIPQPEPEPEPVIATIPRTDWDPTQHVRNADFQRMDSTRHREAGQTVRVVEPFTLERIGIVVSGPSIALPGFRDYPDGTDFSILEPFVENPGVVEDLAVNLSLVLYRSPLEEGFPTVRRLTSGFGPVVREERETIRVSDLIVVSDQPLVGRISAGLGVSLLDLSEPVLVEPGHWLVGLRIDKGLDDVDLLDFVLTGVESGDTVDEGSGDFPPCEYARTPDPYPDGAFYWREDATSDFFIPAFAKVTECITLGRYDNIMNEGDIILDLYGTPAG